jgi:hypothetical protein
VRIAEKADKTHWGVEGAQGWVSKEQILNCLGIDQLATYLAARREQTSGNRRAGEIEADNGPKGHGCIPRHRDPYLNKSETPQFAGDRQPHMRPTDITRTQFCPC